MSPEVQILRRQVADTREKLQEYADTIVSLHAELRTLRDRICKSCKLKFVPANLVSSQSAEPAADSPSDVNQKSQSVAKRTISTFSWRWLLKAHDSDYTPRPPSSGISQNALPISSTTISPPPVLTTIHGNGTAASTSKPLTTTSSQVITPQTVTTVPRWSAQRDAIANAALDVTFERALIHKGQIRSIRFSPDGMYLAVAANDKNWTDWLVFIYNVETCVKDCELKEYASKYSSIQSPPIKCLCFSPDGKYLVVGDEACRVTVWDIPKKQIRNIFRGPYVPRSVDFSPNGRLVVSACWACIFIWNMRDGSARVFNGNNACGFWAVRVSPDGRFVAAGDFAGIVRVWDIRTGQLVKRWTGHNGSAQSVVFLPDGRGLMSGSRDGVLNHWDVSSPGTSGEPVVTKILDCAKNRNTVAVSPDAKWIVAGLLDKRTVIWDAHSAIRQFTLIGHMGSVFSVDVSPAKGYLALGSHDGHVSLWRYQV